MSVADIDQGTSAAAENALTARCSEAAYAVANGWVIHGQLVRHSDLAKWAPVVTLHPKEPWFPSSIDSLLRGATVVDVDGNVLKHTQSQADLRYRSHIDDRLLLPASSVKGEPLDARGRVQAPMYVSAQVPADGSFVDLNYMFLYGYNGSQGATLRIFGHVTDLVLPQFAHHYGDIESISVRVTPDFERAIFVRFEQHGESTFVKPQDVQFVDGTHPTVLSALNSHASYNAKGLSGMHRNVNAKLSALGNGIDLVDITESTGVIWAPFEVDAEGRTHDIGQLRFVGLDESGQVLGDQAWAAYMGRVGDTLTNQFTGAQLLDGTSPTWAQRTFANTLVRTAILTGRTQRFKRVDGPIGLAGRRTVHVTRPTWNPREF